MVASVVPSNNLRHPVDAYTPTGAVSVPLSTRVHGHALAPGHYRVLMIPTDTAGHRSLPQVLDLQLARH